MYGRILLASLVGVVKITYNKNFNSCTIYDHMFTSIDVLPTKRSSPFASFPPWNPLQQKITLTSHTFVKIFNGKVIERQKSCVHRLSSKNSCFCSCVSIQSTHFHTNSPENYSVVWPFKKWDDFQILFEEIKMHPASAFCACRLCAFKEYIHLNCSTFSLGNSQSRFKVSGWNILLPYELRAAASILQIGKPKHCYRQWSGQNDIVLSKARNRNQRFCRKAYFHKYNRKAGTYRLLIIQHSWDLLGVSLLGMKNYQ